VRESTLPGRPSLAALLVAAAVLAGCSANTYEPFSADTGGEAEDEGLVKGMMTSLGAIDPREKPIEYRPRAALVVPPKAELRAPEDTDAALANRQFPTNPEDRTIDRPKAGNPSAVLSLAEQEKFRNLPRGGAAQLPSLSPQEAGRALPPDKLQNAEVMRAAAISQREQGKKSLLAPPTEYATPSPNAPFEEEKKESSWKPSWWPL
jgi:hypothetical protein